MLPVRMIWLVAWGAGAASVLSGCQADGPPGDHARRPLSVRHQKRLEHDPPVVEPECTDPDGNCDVDEVAFCIGSSGGLQCEVLSIWPLSIVCVVCEDNEESKPPCDSNADCKPGEVCEAVDDPGAPKHEPPAAEQPGTRAAPRYCVPRPNELRPCRTNRQCAAGEICVHGRCAAY
jgi:hypothetical protein